MARFFIDSGSYAYQKNSSEVSKSNLDTDYPYHIKRWKEYKWAINEDINMVKIRRWAERVAAGDIYFEQKIDGRNGKIYNWYWNIYFEFEEDATLFTLTWT